MEGISHGEPEETLHGMLRCPRSGARLRPASVEECDRARELAGGEVAWDAGLVDESGACFYPVEDGIPVVVAERGIILA